MSSSIEISAPGKVILFGEWAVVEGSPAIVTALDCRLSLRVDPITGSATEFVSGQHQDRSEDLSRPLEGFFGLASKVLIELNLLFNSSAGESPWRGQRLTFDAGWPIEEGLGSSSAVVLALMMADATLRNRAMPISMSDTTTLWRHGRDLIRRVQSPRASGLDLAGQILGGTVLLQGEMPLEMKLEIPTELRLLHTGGKISTEAALGKVRLSTDFLRTIQQSVMGFLGTHDWLTAIRLHSMALESLGVVPREVTEARIEWMENDWIEALKTTGAGGGDAILVWINPLHEAELRADVARRGWWFSDHKMSALGWTRRES